MSYLTFPLFIQLMRLDARISFICLDFPDFVEHIQVIAGKD